MISSTYVPPWPTLSPRLLLHPRTEDPPFPWCAPGEHGFQGRGLIYRLLRARGIGPGDVVVAPEYHHGNEIRAIRATGAVVRFYPVGVDLRPDLPALKALLAERPRALLVIHYNGWPQPLDELLPLCRTSGTILIEDCALALLSEPEGRPLGSRGDYAVFCLYKTLPLPDGAMLVTNDPLRHPLPPRASRSCGITTLAGRCLELTTDQIRSKAPRAGSLLARMKRRVGRGMSACGIDRHPVGDMGFDTGRALLDASSLSRLLAARCDFAAIRRRRRANYARLADALAGRARFLDRELPPGACPLFFPLLVADKPRAAAFFRARGIEATELWNEGADGPQAIESDGCTFLRRHVLELPIHQDVTDEQIRYTAEQALALHAREGRP